MQNVNSGRCAVVWRGKLNLCNTENHCVSNHHSYMILDSLVPFCENVHHAICYAHSPLVIAVVTICLAHDMQGVWPYKCSGLEMFSVVM